VKIFIIEINGEIFHFSRFRPREKVTRSVPRGDKKVLSSRNPKRQISPIG